MRKYKRFVDDIFPKISRALVIMVAFLVIGYLLVQSFIPMDTKELEQYNEKIELLKQDFSNLSQIENISQEFSDDTIIITFDGRECDMKVAFTKDGVYMYRIIIDDRICTNFGRSFLVIILAVASVWLFLSILEMVLQLPIICKSFQSKKNKGGIL